MTAPLPDPRLLITQPTVALWERLGERLVTAVFEPKAAARFEEGWPAFFPEESDARQLTAELSESAGSLWAAPRLAGARPEEKERERMARIFRDAPGGQGALAESLGRWFAAGLSERLQTGLPDFHWLLAMRRAWLAGPFQNRTARQILEHLRGTTLMHPMPSELPISLAPETFLCLFLLAASFHTAVPLYRLTWWNRVLRFFRLSYKKEYVPVVRPLDQLRLVAERALAETAAWAGAWDQYVLAGACLRWKIGTRWKNLSQGFREQLLTLPLVALEPPAPDTPLAEPLPSWNQPGAKDEVPLFLQREGVWRQSLSICT